MHRGWEPGPVPPAGPPILVLLTAREFFDESTDITIPDPQTFPVP